MESEEQWRRLNAIWEAGREHFHHSDRAAVDLGIAGLNSITLLNGGAIVALLAFVGQVWDDGKGANIVKAIIDASTPFGFGVLASGASFFFAYFYQSSVTRKVDLGIASHFNPPPDKKLVKRVDRLFTATKYLMVLASVSAYALFAWGVFRVSIAFVGLPSSRG